MLATRRAYGSRATRSPVPPASAPDLSLEFAPDDHARDADRRLRVSDRRSLSILSASPGGISEVAPHHIYLTHELRALTDERRASQRLGQLPISDSVALGDLECEVAGHHVDLTSAHLLHKDSVLDRPKDLRGVRGAWRDNRGRH